MSLASDRMELLLRSRPADLKAPMLDIPGYEIDDVIFTSSASTVCRGRRDEDDKPVILKVTRADPPRPADIARFNCEYAILATLAEDGGRDQFWRVRHGNRLVLVTEDIGARSLAHHVAAGKLDTSAFLRVAIKTVERLAAIHRANIIHKDINPNNIIWNPDTDELKIIDFNISSVHRREKPTVSSLDVLEGTLAYIAPEQTGRMNRDIDYRSDLYSLGATFYRLLAGRRPFENDDITEMLHAHLAIDPPALHTVNEDVPEVLSTIVMKLLNKEPERRYQSTHCLRADLQTCLDRIGAEGRIEPFEIAIHDISERFQIPQRLYGREEQTQTLIGAFDGVCEGALAVTLVAGYSGIGKSALVHELYKPLTRKRGHFTAGKYEQYRRNIPYAGLVAAFQNLVRELLTKPEAQLTMWRHRLGQALGRNGAVITEVISEVELIVGAQPPVQQLAPAESQNRFNRVFLDFIRALCHQNHPLVLFLDDLQWADSASIKLLELMIASDELEYLHIVGAYRDNEVSPTHPLIVALTRQTEAGRDIHTIELAPLSPAHISALLSDTLRCHLDSVQPLAQLVGTKTSGNPFFVSQFLTTLYHNDVLVFDHNARRWTWSLDEVDALGLTDNVVDLMVRRVNHLPRTTVQTLRLAACLGSRFDVELLTLIEKKSAIEVHESLLPALTDRFIVPLTRPEPAGEGMDARLMAFHYRFSHDRVQQATHSLLDEHEMQSTHLQIGQLLLDNLSADERDDRLFEIVDHLNVSRALVKDPSELIDLAQLNLEAARKAKDATAYAPARWYLDTGIQCLPEDPWQSHYQLTVELHTGMGEIEYLTGDQETSNKLFDLLLDKVKTPLEKAEICNLLIVLYTLSARYPDALNLGRKALGYVGVSLPDDDFEAAQAEEMRRYTDNLDQRDIPSLIELPQASQPDKRIAIKLLAKMGPLTFFADPALFPIVSTRTVSLSLEYGPLPDSAVGYGNFGLYLGTALSDYSAGYAFARLAKDMSVKFNNLAQQCVSSVMLGGVLNHWVNHISEGIPHLEEGYRAGMDSGEYPWVGFLLCWQLYLEFHLGKPLAQVLAAAERSLIFCRMAKHQMATLAISGGAMGISNLLGNTSDQDTFGADGITEMDEAELLSSCQEHGEFSSLTYYQTLKAQILYLNGEHRDALALLEQTAESLMWIPGTMQTAAHNFYHSLAITAVYPDSTDDSTGDSTEQRQTYDAQLASNQETMRTWMDSCPDNFENMYLLVEAERARIRGDEYRAIKLYNRAIESAKTYGYTQNYALGNELAAQCWLALDNATYARAHMNDALRGYSAWGARAKVARLSETHVLLLERRADSGEDTTRRRLSESSSESSTSSTVFPVSTVVDINTVIQASQAIASETVLHALLHRLLDIALKNVGADLGYVIMADEDGQFRIEAGVALRDGHDAPTSYPAPLDAQGPSSGHDVVPQTLINYVSRTRQPVVLPDASNEGMFTSDPYTLATQPHSIMCAPIVNQGRLIGLVYLENNLVTNAFTPARLDTTQLLAAQAAISIENARLLGSLRRSKEELERKVEERTSDLRSAKDLAERANRAKSDFLSNINHELRTPMNGVIGMIELMLRYEHIAEQREYLETAQASAEQLMRIINDTLDLSRIEAGKLVLASARFSLEECIETLVRMMSLRMQQKGLAFRHALDADVAVALIGDRNRLLQILINLLGNAIKFTDAGGTISLYARTETRTDDHVVLRFGVRDTGVGIPRQAQETIFDTFTQAPAAVAQEYVGSGLGLSIVSRLVALMDGRIEVESELGEGSHFHFTARFGLWSGAEEPEPVQVDAATEDENRTTGVQLRILVVEDNRINRMVATRFLGIEGHEVVTAENGVEALDIVQSETFDAVLMDVQMPEMDGFEATRAIRRIEKKTGAHVPIFAMTAYSMAEEIDKCHAVGMDDYLSKPIRPEALRELLAPVAQRKLDNS